MGHWFGDGFRRFAEDCHSQTVEARDLGVVVFLASLEAPSLPEWSEPKTD